MNKSRIEECIDEIIISGSKVLSVFLTCGFPSKDKFEHLALSILDAGADMIELGVPFSDPIADGPVIQSASQTALLNKINLDSVLETAGKIKSHTDKPLVLMGYANPFLSYGTAKLAAGIKESQIEGIIVPDVPVDEYDDFFGKDFKDIDTIMLISPTSSPERVKEIGRRSSGFVYCVSMKGVTGGSGMPDQSAGEYVKKTKAILPKQNLLVGFGISDENSARFFAQVSDGIIVGSAVIRMLSRSNGNFTEVINFIKRIKASIEL